MTKKTTKKALIASLLSLLLCFSMLIGTTFAWFTDSVTSSGNIIQSGTLDVEMYWAEGNEDPASATWTDASQGAMFNNNLWEPGYVEAKHIQVKNNGTLALNWEIRIVANGVVSKLADVIDVYYFDAVTKLDRTTAITGTKLGTLTEILGTSKNLANTACGELLAGATKEFTLALKMQESAGNEYQGLAIGTDFSVELIATQASYESDGFGTDYDADGEVPNPALPAALVRPLENLTIDTTGSKMGADLGEFTLSAGYKFEPTMSLEEASNSEYRYWHADFVISVDRDVPANSIALAGYYDAWCSLNNDKWVALTSPETVTKGTEIRLVELLGATVNWEELCNYGNDGLGFQCGLAALDPDALAGTTITVELRLYETTKAWDATSGSANEETGEYIIVGVFEYTFPVTNYVDSAEDLAAEIAAGNSVALTEDIVVSSTLNVAKDQNVDIDLNGHNLSYAVANDGKAAAVIANKGNMKIFGEGTISFVAADPDLQAIPAYATNTITNTGNLVIGEGVVVTNGSDGGASYAVDVQSGSFVLDGGTLIGNRCALRIARYNGDAEFVMNSGRVEAMTPAWIQLPGSDANTAPSIKVEINGGTFQSTKATSADNDVLYTYSFGNSHANTVIVINGGEFLGGTVSIGSGYKGDVPALTINGGTFEYDVLQWMAGDTSAVIYAANK